MTIEHAETVPTADDPQRYPTSREIVDAALAQGATLATKPTSVCRNYAVPCEDLDGNPHQLVVVALGERIALAGPGGATVVLHDHAVGALGDSLQDTLVAKVHGGNVRIGQVDVDAKHEVFIHEKAPTSRSPHARQWNSTSNSSTPASPAGQPWTRSASSNGW